jgi:hypothetical protein
MSGCIHIEAYGTSTADWQIHGPACLVAAILISLPAASGAELQVLMSIAMRRQAPYVDAVDHRRSILAARQLRVRMIWFTSTHEAGRWRVRRTPK